MINFLNDTKYQMLQKTLDATWDRMSVISDNITNKDTPGYKTKKLEFENILRNKINAQTQESPLHALRLRAKVFPQPKQTIDGILNSVKPIIFTDPSTQRRVDGNNVDEDHENLEMVRTKIQYDYLVKKISDEYHLLKHAISEGRG